MQSLLIVAYIIFPICNAFKPIEHICAAPSTQGNPLFREGTQFDFNYQSTENIKQYDDIENNNMESWPTLHNIWGFTAATISMNNGEKKFEENILIHSIPIYITNEDKPLSIVRPRGKHFYVFSTSRDTKTRDTEEYKAIEIQLWGQNKVGGDIEFDKLKIDTTPTRGSVEGDRTFCNSVFREALEKGHIMDKKQTEGLCFGKEECCDAFTDAINDMGPRKGSMCKKILMCPGGVIKFDLSEYSSVVPGAIDWVMDGIKSLEILAAEYTAAEKMDTEREFKSIMKTGGKDYICPDGSYHIELSCPFKSSSLNKKPLSEEMFHECPFCAHGNHKYRMVAPGEDQEEISGKCGNNEKKTRFAFEFINDKNDFMSCCVKKHTMTGTKTSSAYNKHSIKKEMKSLKEIAEKQNDMDMSKKQNEGQTLRDTEEKAKAKSNISLLDRSGSTVEYSMSRSIIIGAFLLTIFMIISSSFIYIA